MLIPKNMCYVCPIFCYNRNWLFADYVAHFEFYFSQITSKEKHLVQIHLLKSEDLGEPNCPCDYFCLSLNFVEFLRLYCHHKYLNCFRYTLCHRSTSLDYIII